MPYFKPKKNSEIHFNMQRRERYYFDAVIRGNCIYTSDVLDYFQNLFTHIFLTTHLSHLRDGSLLQKVQHFPPLARCSQQSLVRDILYTGLQSFGMIHNFRNSFTIKPACCQKPIQIFDSTSSSHTHKILPQMALSAIVYSRLHTNYPVGIKQSPLAHGL